MERRKEKQIAIINLQVVIWILWKRLHFSFHLFYYVHIYWNRIPFPRSRSSTDFRGHDDHMGKRGCIPSVKGYRKVVFWIFNVFFTNVYWLLCDHCTPIGIHISKMWNFLITLLNWFSFRLKTIDARFKPIDFPKFKKLILDCWMNAWSEINKFKFIIIINAYESHNNNSHINWWSKRSIVTVIFHDWWLNECGNAVLNRPLNNSVNKMKTERNIRCEKWWLLFAASKYIRH